MSMLDYADPGVSDPGGWRDCLGYAAVESVPGVGWVEALASHFLTSWRTVGPVEPAPTGQSVAESAGTYILRLSGRRREGMLDVLGR